jgi:hypothetical protein
MLHMTPKSLAAGLVAVAALASGPAIAQTAADRFVPFGEFLQNLRAAPAAQFLGAARGNGVTSAAAVEEMRSHILSLYDGVTVQHSFVLDDQYFDCVPILQQPSARAQGLMKVPALPARLPLADPAADDNDGQAASQLAPGETADRFGNAMPCEPGTIPMRRVTLEELSRFHDLREFLQKGPNGAGQVPTRNKKVAATHKYAHAYQDVMNFGGVSTVNIWKPQIDTAQGEIFSLSQHWYVAFPGGVTQTAEIGWQNFPQKYGSQNSALFIYWTADGYHNTGCYNLDCAAFVQTSNSIMLGGRFAKYSKKGGKQNYLTLGYQMLTVTNVGPGWAMVYGGEGNYVGYYPASLYGNASGALSQGATEIDYGGETVGTTIWPPMGSGKFPGKGVKFSGLHKKIKYFTAYNISTTHNATLTQQQPSPTCYKIDVHNNSTGKLKSFFYFGGPGGQNCGG